MAAPRRRQLDLEARHQRKDTPMETTPILLVLLAVLMGASPVPARRPAPAPGPADKDAAAVVNGGNAFAIDLYAHLAAGEKGNLFFSPSSIHTALAMTYAGARGRTARQMADTLHFTLDEEKLHPAFAALLKKLNNPRRDYRRKLVYELVVANALWNQKGYPFRRDFIELVRSSYGGALNELDFQKQPETSRRKINEWAAEQTRDKIKDLIPPGLITPLTRMVLTNAIYFKSNWMRKFRESATRDAPFHLSPSASIRAPMMHRQDRFGYSETETVQALELPYMYHDLSMIVLLPRKVDGLAALERDLTAENLTRWLRRIRNESVRVTLPKFRYTSRFSLAETLKAMGMTDAFVFRAADFSGMTTVEELFISDVIHKAFVAVDEEGTEAAAATAVGMATGAAMPRPAQPKVFKADHPFVFLIRHRATGGILFLGRVANPKES